MKKIALIIFLVLFGTFALAATEKDFRKVNFQENVFFTHKDIINADYYLGTDKIFYGSKEGSVIMKVYFAEKDGLIARDFKLGLETKSGRNIIVTKVKIGESEFEINNPQPSNSFIFNQAIRTETGFIQSAEIYISFDPLEIGIREEIDVILYSKNLQELLRDDPFISGFGRRQKGTLNTDGIGLGGNITENHSILYYIDPSNTDFWTGDTLGTGNGITFAQSDETTEYDFDIEKFSNADNNAWFWVEVTETFTSGSDLETWFYYDGVDVDNSDGTGAYPSSYLMVQHLEETSSTHLDSTTNNNDSTAIVVTAQGTANGQINGADDLDGIDDVITVGTVNNMTFGTNDYTILAWANVDGFTNSGSEATGNLLTMNANVNGEIVLAYMYDDHPTESSRRKYLFQARDSGGSGKAAVFSSTTGINSWHMVAGQRASSNTFISVDGVNWFAGTTGANRNVSAPSDLFLGKVNTSGINFLDGKLDEVKVFNYALSNDELILLFNSESNNLITFGAEETPTPDDFNLTFNVFQGTGTEFDLDNLTIDFNVDFYDASDLTSPFTINDVNAGDYLITISSPIFDSNTFVLTVDANKTLTIYLDKFVYPVIAQFITSNATTTNLSDYQTINTHRFETNFGSSSGTDISCTLWASSNNGSERSGFWRIQTSDNAVDWIDRKITERTLPANTTGASIYISTPDYNISDGNHFFRIQHRRQIGASFDMNTNDVVCENFIARDQNNFIIPDFHNEQVGLSTTNSEFENIASKLFTTDPFNGLFYFYGDLIYNQTIAKGISSLLVGLQGIADSNSSEFPRTTEAGAIGIGGLTGLFTNLDRSTGYTAEGFGKTSAGTISFDANFHIKYINQREGEFDVNKNLNGTTLATTEYTQLLSIPITITEAGDFKALAILPFSCSEANCDFNILMQLHNGSFDVNSLSHKRTSDDTIGDIGILINQFLFEDTSTGSAKLIVWAKTSTGTITIEGGSVSIIHAKSIIVEETNPPQDPLIFAPTNGADVNGVSVDFNCFTTDPNGDTLVYDVNIIVRDTNNTALILQTGGDGSGTFDSTLLGNNTYSISCVARETGTDELFSSTFDNSNYQFTITNISPPTITINPIISPLCEIETTAGAKTKRFLQEGLHRKPYTFITTIQDSNGISQGLDPNISFRNSDLNILIFKTQNMTENFIGEYIFTKEMSLEDGLYSYFINVDSNCFKTFFLEIEGEPKIVSSNIEIPLTQAINSSFDLNFFLLLGITIVLAIGTAGLLFVKSIRDRILNMLRGGG